MWVRVHTYHLAIQACLENVIKTGAAIYKTEKDLNQMNFYSVNMFFAIDPLLLLLLSKVVIFSIPSDYS